MSDRNTVTINGRLYDALTGMPVGEVSPKAASSEKVVQTFVKSQQAQTSTQIHAAVQRSQTLNRHIIKKPVVTPTSTIAPRTAPRPVIQKSPAITKFAPHPQTQKPIVARRVISDIGPVNHPKVAKVHEIQQIKKQVNIAPTAPKALAPKPSQIIKQEAIAAALDKAPTKKQQKAPKKQNFFARFPRALSIGSASLAVILLGGYFTYLNMPSLSVRVAAAQAGIDASYPEYHPDGYRLAGPIAAESGEVTMKFAANSGPQNFVVSQTKSSWDSSAVVTNLVKPASNNSYTTTNERGLTIYTYDGNAAWVNGGILYTIEGDAPLSGEQIRRIATSL